MGYYASHRRAVKLSQAITENEWRHTTSSLQRQLDACRSTIETTTDKSIYTAADGKAMVLFHLQSAFGDMAALAGRIAGNIDGRTAKGNSELFQNLPLTLAAHIKEATQIGESSSAAIKQALTQVTEARTRLSSIMTKISDAKAKLTVEREAAKQDVDQQVDAVAQAETRLESLRSPRSGSPSRNLEADNASQTWREWFSSLQGLSLGGAKIQRATTPPYERNLQALMAREAADISSKRSEQAELQLATEQAKLIPLEARLTRVDRALSEIVEVERCARKYVGTCDNSITCCRQVDGVMSLCKQNLNVMLTRCLPLEDTVPEYAQAQTKEDLVSAILGCLTYGLLDNSLVGPARATLWALEIGDDTKILHQSRFADEVNAAKRVLSDFTKAAPASKL